MTASPIDRPTEEEEMSAPARTLVFSPLGSTDVPSAVVHRLRAAIGLGLLPDGKRLPKESELAGQLGVTTFALREALAELRRQGLVVTRAGKYGGSFVTYPVESERLEYDELVTLSAAELRDVGDWRQMLTGQTASLAAQRASSSTVATLSSLASRAGEADSGVEARRVHGRFQLELASAAHSMRMTRAEFALHEQVDWLFGLVLNTSEQRAECAASLAAIARMVKARNAKRARRTAEEHVGRMMGQLARLRLEVIAAGQDRRRSSAGSLAGEVSNVVDVLMSSVAGLAEDVRPSFTDGSSFDQVRNRIATAGLRRLDEGPEFIEGLGVLFEVGLFAEHPYWIEWWLRSASGPVNDNHHVLDDPSREDFYDYEQMEIMARPRETGRPWVYGPYVDYGGSDDYIVSVAAPIQAGDRFCGISCADIRVGDLESALSPMLAAAEESFLLNSEDRVIVSNSVAFGVGEVMTEKIGCAITDFPEVGWTLATRAR